MPHEYNIILHKSIIRLRLKTQTETQTTSTLLAQDANQEPIPRLTKKKKNSKTSIHHSHVRSLPYLYLQLVL